MNLQTPASILWMVEQLKLHRRFTYQSWAREFRTGQTYVNARQDRKFQLHLQFLRDSALPILTSEGTTLTKETGTEDYCLQGNYTGEVGWSRLDDPQWADFFPLFLAMNRQPSLVPFSLKKVERKFKDIFDFPEGLEDHVFYKNAASSPIDTQLIRTLFDAFHQMSAVEVNPLAPRETATLTPIFVIGYDGSWYLIGKSGQWTLQYNLSRVKSIRLVPDAPEPMEKAHLKALRSQLESVYGIAFLFPEGGVPDEPTVVTVRYTGRAATFAMERYAHHAKVSNGVVVTFKVNVYYELISEMMRWGADAEPIEPEDFRQEWIAKISGFLPFIEKNKN